jgi:hypothetical protein
VDDVLGHTGIFDRHRRSAAPGLPATRPGTVGLRCPACFEPVAPGASRIEPDPSGAPRVVCGSCGQRVTLPLDAGSPPGRED